MPGKRDLFPELFAGCFTVDMDDGIILTVGSDQHGGFTEQGCQCVIVIQKHIACGGAQENFNPANGGRVSPDHF